jgi:hypothetical protein
MGWLSSLAGFGQETQFWGQATKPTGPALAPIYAARGVKSEDNWDMAEFQPFSGGDVARAQGDGLMFDALWTFKIADSAE